MGKVWILFAVTVLVATVITAKNNHEVGKICGLNMFQNKVKPTIAALTFETSGPSEAELSKKDNNTKRREYECGKLIMNSASQKMCLEFI